ncbi:MAG TPA: metal-dependent hydrolase [Longimicrobiales bacterium]|nr:metal-dependent hydrolase [Longimicrobiales bacterium]
MPRLTWHGHSTFTLETDQGHRLLFDPFLDDNPRADVRVEDVGALDYILISHGHHDHFEDAIPLAKETGATILAIYEIAAFCESRGIRKTRGLNIGGGARFPFGYARMTPALHSGQVAGDESGRHTAPAAGWWLDLIGGKRLYHAGDTALMTDMQLLKGKVDVALLPIGDTYTMGPGEAARAVELIEPRVVIPMHYSTWDEIEQDPNAFRDLVGDRAEVVILDPGDSYNF